MGFCTQSKQTTDQPQYFDPLGPAAIGANGKPVFAPTGGVPQRNRIFGLMNQNSNGVQEATNNLVGGLKTAAANPGFTDAANLAQHTIQGDYLHGSPELDAAMATSRRATMADAANEGARIKSQYGRAGIGFGTAAQQADQSNRAAASGQAGATEANARLQNYEQERQNQQAAPTMLQQAVSAPLNYLSQISSAYNAPLQQQADLTKTLAGGGSTATPNTTVYSDQGIANQVFQALGNL